MSGNPLMDIVELCLAIDQTSYKIYQRLSVMEKQKELKAFWEEMAQAERVPAEYWKKLLFFVQREIITDVFDDSLVVKAELEKIKTEVDLLSERCKETDNITNRFFIIYSLEFYLLHPAFVLLFHFMKTLPEGSIPEEHYDDHINKIIDALHRYGVEVPELEVLGKTIRRLWHYARLLTIQSTIDTLTGLLNRRGLFSSISLLANLGKRHKYGIGVMMIDIDRFKKINDTYGHQKGDQVLQQVAGILKSNIRSCDALGRYGGEEFLAFLSPVEVDALPMIGEKLRNYVEQETKENIPITVSIGISKGMIKADVKAEVDTLIKRADEALYKAKNKGRNKVFIWGT